MVITDTLAGSLREVPRPIGTPSQCSRENRDGTEICENFAQHVGSLRLG